MPAGDLDHGHVVFVGDIGNTAQLGRVGHAAPHPWHHRISAVFLNIGVSAFVDQARLRIVLCLAWPGGNQVIVQRRTAGGAAVGGAPVHVAHGASDGQQVLLADGLADLPVVQVAATADGFFALRFDVRRAAHGVDQNLLHQTGARAAGAGCLGVLLHVIDAEQAMFLNRLDDGPFADAIAAADFGAVGHAHGFVLTLVADIAQGVFAEHQVVADFIDLMVFADLPEVPAAVCGVAIQAGADQDVILDHQLFIDPANRVGQGDGFSAFAAHEVASGKQVDAGHFQLGRGHRALIARKAQLCQVVGADLGLFEQRRHQPVGNAAMAGAFADGIHARVVGLQGVVDQNPPVAGDASLFGQFGGGADASGHDHQIGRDHIAVLELHGFHPAFAVIEQCLGLFFQAERQAALFQFHLQ